MVTVGSIDQNGRTTSIHGFTLILRKIAERLQLDRSLVFVLVSRLWQAMTGPVTIALIIWFLSQDEQGVYYALVPIIGIQAFFELGLLNVLIAQAGHAHSAYQQAVPGSDEARCLAARLGELIRSSRRWFGAASVLFALTAVAIGWSTFSQNPVQVDWQPVLLVIVPLAATTVYWSPSLAILEGVGDRELIYRVRFYQMACGSFCVWAALAMGWGIWSLVIATMVQAFVSAYVVLIYRREFFDQFSSRGDEHDFSWVRDVLPLQWRVAVGGLLYHIATQFLAVCVMTFHSAAESGRLGMTISITTAIQMLAMAWVQTKYPLISAMHGEGDREKAGTLWRHTTLVSSIILWLAFIGLFLGVAALSLFQRGWEDRFIELKWIAVLGIGCLANHGIALQAFYVMARGKKPFVAAPVVGYLITTACVWVGGYHYSIAGVVTGFTAGTTLVVLPLYTWSYWCLRRGGEETQRQQRT